MLGKVLMPVNLALRRQRRKKERKGIIRKEIATMSEASRSLTSGESDLRSSGGEQEGHTLKVHSLWATLWFLEC